MIELNKAGTSVSSGPLPLQRAKKIPTTLLRFEDHHGIHKREVHETNAVTEETRKLGRNERKCTASLAAITTAIKSQVNVAAGL